ncbi:TetR family transcriptional regulator [Streptomyces sp. HNM0663]|uniref:TetR family transcriptional regulator n=1 Tax=Streptomyces chengmaiensis TaxID=3040919 RepID=A0ABT6HMY6_9ACTN|nr:TetR family transcriptional regulator [Streptomyces chengmaiensis]MDH2389657.1 TetR family transcriptional regulator [Streptomyces chengmaiensis]
MPRPSMRAQRSQEILAAYVRCVARFGLEGATQERIADEAGVKRPLLRHYLGNREQMIESLTRYVADRFTQETRELEIALGATGAPADLIDKLFLSARASDADLFLAYQALVSAADSHPGMREPLVECFEQFLRAVERILRRHRPHASASRIRAASHGIAAAYMAVDGFAPLNPPGQWREDLKAAAVMLISIVDEDQPAIEAP